MKADNRKKTGIEKGESVEETSKRALGKTHVDYWRTRLFQPGYVPPGGTKRILVPTLAVKIGHGGKREQFNLHTSNAAVAAEKARKIYLRVVGAGWDAAIAEFKPKAEKRIAVSTVGELIAAAGKVPSIRPNSLRAYCYALRRLASDVTGLGEMPAKTAAYATDEFKAWRKKVDAVPLSKLTDERINAWRDRLIASRKTPVDRERAKITANSVLRNARTLFGDRMVEKLRETVTLPTPLPFDGIKVGKTTKRFRADVSALELFEAGKKEFRDGKTAQPEVWKAFALCLLGGLRKREADTLMRAQVRLDDRVIQIRRTAHFEPKSEEAARDIDLSPEAVTILRTFLEEKTPDPVFVLRGGPSKPLSPYEYYRADLAPWETWSRLSKWLRSKGVKGSQPIHSLRKLAGSLIHERFGIEAARGFLGHADIATTSASYLDKKRVAVSFGDPEPAKPEKPQPAPLPGEELLS